MKTLRMILLMGFCLPLIPAYADTEADARPSHGLFIPRGNAEAGRKAFVDLKCTACHQVREDSELPHPLVDFKGPTLGKLQARYSVGWLANSIISPSHWISTGWEDLSPDSELSRMGDFNEVMTVRQLLDILEYLKSLDEKAKETEKGGE